MHASFRFTLRATALAACLLVAPITHAQVFNWAGGTFVAGATAPSPLASGQTLNINSGGFKYLDGAVSHFSTMAGSTVNWTADNLYLMNGVSVTNGGLWNATADASLVYNGGTGPTFTNDGAFRKSVTAGTTVVGAGVGFVNNGTIDALTGTIRFDGGATFNAGSVFSGAGAVWIHTGTNAFNGSFNSANLTLAGGTHLGTNAVVNGSVGFQGGALGGTWSVASGQTMSMQSGGFKYVDGAGSVLTNGGTFHWIADNLYVQNGGAVVNNGLWDAKGDNVVTNNGGVSSFTNHGTLRKSGGTGVTTIAVGLGFVNDGALQAETGTIRYTGGSTFNAGTVFSGAGVNDVRGNNGFNGAFTSANLVINDGTQTGSGAVIGGSVDFSGGALAGTWTVGSGQTLVLNNGGFKYVDGATTVLTNAGTVNWTADNLYLQNGGQVVNNGLWNATGDNAIFFNGGLPTGFTNNGTFRKSAGAGVSTVGSGLGFVNNGTIDAQTGTIRFVGGSSFDNGTSFTGAGVNEVRGGTQVFAGAIQSANLLLADGVHDGSAAELGGTTAFSGGTFSGGWTLKSGHTLTIQNGGFKYVNGASSVLTNAGTLAWTGDNLYVMNGGSVVNSGTWDSKTDQALLNNGGASAFTNTGTLRKSGGAGATVIGNNLGFVNSGTLDAQVGMLRYDGGSTFNAGTVFTGAGANVASGNNTFAGGFTSSNLLLSSGTHTGIGAVVNGSVVFAGGVMSGGWTVAAGQSLDSVSGGFKYLGGAGSTLTNHGTLNWTTTDALYLQNGATLLNAGTMNLDRGAVFHNGGTVGFVNTGLVRKAGADTATIGNGIGFDNQGVIDVQAGTLVLPAGFTNNGTLMGDGTVQLAGTLSNQGTIAPGSTGPGTLSVTGSFAQAAAGVFSVELGDLVGHDLLLVSGSAVLDGTLAISCHGACSFAAGDSIVILDAVGDLTGEFSQVMFQGFSVDAFSIVYDRAADLVRLDVTQDVTAAIPEPGTVALWSAGLALLAGIAGRRRRSSRPGLPGAERR